VSYGQVREILRSAGFQVSSRNPDLGVVVGGDGVFSEFGRNESVPLLFVGVRSNGATGSKAFLGSVYFDELATSLREIQSENSRITEFRRLEVTKNGVSLGDVFTDLYMQRGADSNCIRYHLQVRGSGTDIAESAIGDGVVISTRAGSTGYFSYLDKLKNWESLKTDGYTLIGENEIGICHILPTYTAREGSDRHPVRYVVPWGCTIEMKIDRPVDARLYGLGWKREGVKVSTRDTLMVTPSPRTTRVIRMKRPGRPNQV
jgi:hypothetical protein